MHARTNTSEYIRWHFAVRSATRPIQSRPNRKMSRNVGNWKAYSYFFDTRTRALGNARYRESRPYFHFACLTRGVQSSASAPPRQGMRKGGECRKGAGYRGDRGVEQEKRAAADCALVNASRGWCCEGGEREREKEGGRATRHSCVSFLESNHRVYIIRTNICIS